MHQPNRGPGSILASRTKWVLAGFLAIALFFLLTEHRAHVFGILPYLLLLVELAASVWFSAPYRAAEAHW